VVGGNFAAQHAAGFLLGPQQRGVPGAVPHHGAVMTRQRACCKLSLRLEERRRSSSRSRGCAGVEHGSGTAH
jgi:hypothetical protein